NIMQVRVRSAQTSNRMESFNNRILFESRRSDLVQNHMANIQIAFLNKSTVLKDNEIQAAIQPFQKQISRDFAPVWGVDADLSFIPKGKPAPTKTWLIGVFDNSDQAGALG